jgi:hypothetical protein
MKANKVCAQCGETKESSQFVSASGFPNSRGKYCQSCYEEQYRQRVIRLMEGREACLYCDLKIPQELERDHMDPRSRGGWDHPSNFVYVCKACNQRKGDTLFADWLQVIPEKCRDLARRVYVSKHCYQPEEFFPIPKEIYVGKQLEHGEITYGAEWYPPKDEMDVDDYGQLVDPGCWERWYPVCYVYMCNNR